MYFLVGESARGVTQEERSTQISFFFPQPSFCGVQHTTPKMLHADSSIGKARHPFPSIDFRAEFIVFTRIFERLSHPPPRKKQYSYWKPERSQCNASRLPDFREGVFCFSPAGRRVHRMARDTLYSSIATERKISCCWDDLNENICFLHVEQRQFSSDKSQRKTKSVVLSMYVRGQ